MTEPTKNSETRPDAPSEGSELDAVEALRSSSSSETAGEPQPLPFESASVPGPAAKGTCPSCGRPVEVGFKFCDGCGAKLEPAPMPASASVQPPRAPAGSRPATETKHELPKPVASAGTLRMPPAPARPTSAVVRPEPPLPPGLIPPPLRPPERPSRFSLSRLLRRKPEGRPFATLGESGVKADLPSVPVLKPIGKARAPEEITQPEQPRRLWRRRTDEDVVPAVPTDKIAKPPPETRLDLPAEPTPPTPVEPPETESAPVGLLGRLRRKKKTDEEAPPDKPREEFPLPSFLIPEPPKVEVSPQPPVLPVQQEPKPVPSAQARPIPTPPAPTPVPPQERPTRRVAFASRLRRRPEDTLAASSKPGTVEESDAPEQPKATGFGERPGPKAPALGDDKIATDVPVWRPISVPAEEAETVEADPKRYALQLGLAFLAGTAFLLAMAAAASIVTSGRVAILETRGLPIFVAGAVAIVVFTLLRTNAVPVPEPGRGRWSAARGVVVGFVVLVVVAALVYQPAVAGGMQRRLESVLGIFGSDDASAVKSFEQDLQEWNRDAKKYRDAIAAAAGSDINTFRQQSTTTEASLEATLLQMHGHAESARYTRLQDALDDIAAKFDDEFGALRLVSRGFLINDFALVRDGDARFKDARRRAVELFDGRLKPLLQRAGIDPGPFATALSG